MIVEKEIEKAVAIPQEQIRSEKLQNVDNILPFISTHNPTNLTVFPIERKTSKTLGKIL